jgi:hypothetical protein
MNFYIIINKKPGMSNHPGSNLADCALFEEHHLLGAREIARGHPAEV